MMDYEETKRFVEESAWGAGSNDTKIKAMLMLEIEEHLRIANVMRLYELGAITGEEWEALKPQLRKGVGLPAQLP